MVNRVPIVEATSSPAVNISTAASFDAFEAMQRHFAEAQKQQNHIERCLQFAGLPVRLRVVGNALSEHLLPPFLHLCQRQPINANEALTINVWDVSETTVSCPVPAPVQHMIRTVTASEDSRFVADQDSLSLAVFDRRQNRIVAAYSAPDQLHYLDRARPFNRLLSLWYRDHGIQVIHAGLVAKGDRGVLFVGNKGAGKSTCSVGCVQAGFGYLGDDFIGLQEQADGGFVGHSLYDSALLEPNHFQKFHSMQTATRGDLGLPKRMSFISSVFPERLRQHCSISAIVIPEVVPMKESRVSPATKMDALKALAPSSLKLQISPTSEQFQRLTRLIDQVPCYRLQIGESIDDIANCVESLLFSESSNL